MAQSAEDRSRRGGSRRTERLTDEFAGGLRPTDAEWLASLRALAPPDPGDADDAVAGRAEVLARLTRIEAAVAEASFTSRSVLLMFGNVQATIEALDERVRGVDALAASVSELRDAVGRLASTPRPAVAPSDEPGWDDVARTARRMADLARRRLRAG